MILKPFKYVNVILTKASAISYLRVLIAQKINLRLEKVWWSSFKEERAFLTLPFTSISEHMKRGGHHKSSCRVNISKNVHSNINEGSELHLQCSAVLNFLRKSKYVTGLLSFR